MSVYKKRNIFYFNFTYQGVHIQKSTGQANARSAAGVEALAKAALVNASAGNVPPNPPPLIRSVLEQAGFILPAVIIKKTIPTFREFTAEFFEWKSGKCGDKCGTIRFYGDKIRALLRYPLIADAPLDAIDEHLIDQCVSARRKTKRCKTIRHAHGAKIVQTKKLIGKASINRELQVLRTMLKTAERWKYILVAPRVAGLGSEEIRARALTTEEQDLYLNGAPPLLRDYATLALDTGFSPYELVPLRWEDVHFDTGHLHNPHAKREKRVRDIPMTTRVVGVLERRFEAAERPGAGFVFPALKGGDKAVNYRAIESQHDRLLIKLKLPRFRIYDMRHTFGTEALHAVGDIRSVQKLMGHASITMTERYCHPSQERDREVIAKLTEFRAGQDKALAERRSGVTTLSTTLDFDQKLERSQVVESKDLGL